MWGRVWVWLCLSIAGLLPQAGLAQHPRPESLSQLAGLVPEGDAQEVEVLGWGRPGDGGGGFFRYAQTSEMATNLGSVIQPAAAGGRWLRRMDSLEVDPRWFGADAAGREDSRNALQAACNEARRIGGVVIIPKGDYRIVQAAAIYVGNAPLIGHGGRLWNSLPTDYRNPNAAETYSVEQVLDRNGRLTRWNYASSWTNGPWNGKGEMFLLVNCPLVKNVAIDGGWGTTNAPPGVRPIFGVHSSESLAEFTYYQIFSTGDGTRFENCRIDNAPGCVIEGGHDVTVEDCVFGEFGDHVFYFGQFRGTQRNYVFRNNLILTGRAEQGVDGASNHLGASRRAILKFRGNSGIRILSNKAVNRNPELARTIFVDLSVNDSQPGNCEDVAIEGNEFWGERFCDVYSFRSTNRMTGMPGGFRVREVSVRSNTVHQATYAILIKGAVERMAVRDNQFLDVALGGNISGDYRYGGAVRELVFEGNTFQQQAQGRPVFALGGEIESLTLRNNRFVASTNRNGLVVSVSPYLSMENLPVANGVQRLGLLVLEGNVAENYHAWLADPGYAAHADGVVYPYERWDLEDGVREAYCVVSREGRLHRNVAATKGTAPPGGFWMDYTRPAPSRVRMERNVMRGSKPMASPEGLLGLTSETGGGSRKLDYVIESTGNQNAPASSSVRETGVK